MGLRGVARCASTLRDVSPPRQKAFSLLELMIAIVILGLGLIMVATMFPVAWQRARDMNEATVKLTIVESAQTTAKLLLKINGPGDRDNYGSFAGDLLVLTDPTRNPPPPPKNAVPTYADSFVHLLYMENLLVSGGYTPDRSAPSKAVSAPWQLGPLLLNVASPSDLPASFFTSAFGRPQIRFEARVFPPMQPRLNVDVDGSFTGDDPAWENLFDATRHGFAIFHRLRTELDYLDKNTGLPDLNKAKIAIQNPRVFDVYYVTLRRPGATLQYARQDPNPKNIPAAMPTATAVMPKALPIENDVLFPTPWRVQIYVPPQTPDPANPYLQKRNNDETGIPSEVFVNDPMFLTSEFVVDFFQPGTQFIDEANGKVYRVADRRLETSSSGSEKAILTLDQEILLEDLDMGRVGPPPEIPDGTVAPEEALRNVWVFPPPLDGARLPDGTPVFSGKPPVVDIDVRSLTFIPR